MVEARGELCSLTAYPRWYYTNSVAAQGNGVPLFSDTHHNKGTQFLSPIFRGDCPDRMQQLEERGSLISLGTLLAASEPPSALTITVREPLFFHACGTRGTRFPYDQPRYPLGPTHLSLHCFRVENVSVEHSHLNGRRIPRAWPQSSMNRAHTLSSQMNFMVKEVFRMDVVLQVKTTGSAEIVVTAVSTSDNRIDVEDFLGRTVGYVLGRLNRRGYTLSFVTNKFFVCTKKTKRQYQRCSDTRHDRLTLFRS